MVDLAEDAATGRADTASSELATQYRPYLKFDTLEKYRPLDVDAYLADKTHQLCRHVALLPDECRPIHGLRDLRAGFDHIQVDKLTGSSDIEPDVGRDSPVRERIYYHRTDDGDLVHLDYWWFFRFNSSPVATHEMCLRGLAIKETTCFDHEGDWEGVTVTVRKLARGGWAGDSVSYAGHSWRYRYGWNALDDVHAIEDRTHPVVHVARGSHASYPVRCWTQSPAAYGGCRQLGSQTPDGRRNDREDWASNQSCVRCVVELPRDQRGRAALWNAFGGRWGAAACVPGLKLCVRSDGPLSPAFQSKRYDHPGTAPAGSVPDLYRRANVRRPRDVAGATDVTGAAATVR